MVIQEVIETGGAKASRAIDSIGFSVKFEDVLLFNFSLKCDNSFPNRAGMNLSLSHQNSKLFMFENKLVFFYDIDATHIFFVQHEGKC